MILSIYPKGLVKEKCKDRNGIVYEEGKNEN